LERDEILLRTLSTRRRIGLEIIMRGDGLLKDVIREECRGRVHEEEKE